MTKEFVTRIRMEPLPQLARICRVSLSCMHNIKFVKEFVTQ